MPPKYANPGNGPLLQGEILTEIHEHRPMYPSGPPPPGGLSTNIYSIRHQWMVVMSPLCDLEQDFKRVRFPHGQIEEPSVYTDSDDPNTVSHVLLCDAYPVDVVRQRFLGQRTLWEQVESNEHKRYHCLREAKIGDSEVDQLPRLFLDFKKGLALPSVSLYEAIRLNQVKRVAVVPPIYVHDLTQRVYTFLSRVGLPE